MIERVLEMLRGMGYHTEQKDNVITMDCPKPSDLIKAVNQAKTEEFKPLGISINIFEELEKRGIFVPLEQRNKEWLLQNVKLKRGDEIIFPKKEHFE